jgi:hypothetical protein
VKREMSVVPFALQDGIATLGVTVFSVKELVAAPDEILPEGAQATMFVPPSTYTVPPVMRRAKGLAR